MADTKFEVVLGMLFLNISNANIAFGEETLMRSSYTTNKALPTSKHVKLVDPKEFVIAALDADSKTFVMHVAVWEREEIAIDPAKKAQIEAQSRAQTQDKAPVGPLLFDEAPTEVPVEYSNYSNVFLTENVAELPENTGMNEYAIELEEGKQPLFGPIYSLDLVELKTLKTYIKTNLVNGFIWPSKSPARVSILFNRKLDRSLRFCVDYWGFNNITIKN